jgi:thiol-disulfide isomerase/thioredoxin
VLIVAVTSIAFVAACGGGDTSNKSISVPIVSETMVSKAGILPPTATATPPGNEFAIVGQPERFLLEDLSLIGINSWINSDPINLRDLADSGKVVLLDFWTFTCVNCIRTLPYLNAWHEAYVDMGLVIIGVHSPEFDFEKVAGNVKVAAERYDIEYPLALDDNKQTWDKYGNHFWPSKYLISADGDVVLRHFGEGGYREFESIIRGELDKAGYDIESVKPINIAVPQSSETAHTITRELYGGYSKNYLPDGLYAGQDSYYESPHSTVDYTDDGTRRHGQFFLNGQWVNEENAVVSGSNIKGSSLEFSFEFFATSVNSVMSSASGFTEVIVEIDGKPVSDQQFGADVQWNAEGESVVIVSDARLYQILELSEFGKHELVLKTNSEGLAVYTVTFGVNEIGP